MEYRQLGYSGLKVPVLGFGTATFGGGSEFFKAWGKVTLLRPPDSSIFAWKLASISSIPRMCTLVACRKRYTTYPGRYVPVDVTSIGTVLTARDDTGQRTEF
jgi:hypothetical protein